MIAATTSTFSTVRKKWQARAAQLADWALARCVNRTDVWGGYQYLQHRTEGKQAAHTKPAKDDRGRKFLSRNVLIKHFRCGKEGDVVGVHAIGPENTCLSGAVEFDRHSDAPDQPTPEQIWKFATAVREKLVEMGFHALLTDSNGRGGLHLRIFFSEPVESGPLFRFLKQLVADYAEFGFGAAPEVFPKQEQLNERVQYGNWLRLPGRHHTREHLTRVWGGFDWLEGDEAIDAILAIEGDDPALLPFIPPAPKTSQHEGNGHARQPAGNDVIERAYAYMLRVEPAVSGQRGGFRTYRLCCKLLHGFGLTIAEALPILEEWNASCDPPWDRDELVRKLECADRETCERGYFLRDERRSGPAAPGSSATTCEAKDDRPRIEVTADEHLVNDQAVEALASDETLFQRGGTLVHVVRVGGIKSGIKREEGSPRIVPVELASIRERLSRVAVFVCWKEGKDGLELVRQHPPAFCSAAIAARGNWPGIRYLEAITDCPVLRPDGTILDKPGHDPATGLLFEPSIAFPSIPEQPTLEDARRAVAELYEVVPDFPFGESAHKATWLAAVLTLLARRAFPGPAPLFLFDANVMGSGKTLLCDGVALIVTGREAPRMSAPPDDKECKKMILAAAIGGDLLMLIDNIEGDLGWPSLDAVLTATWVKDRLLGENTIVELPMKAVWLASGNNTGLKADASRRVAHVRLECRTENPEERESFQHADLKSWILENRGRLVAAGLTILRAYFVAGRPKAKLKPWGSYEGWSDLIRQALVWVGADDPGSTRKALVQRADRVANGLAQFIDALDGYDPDKEGKTTAEIIQAITPDAFGNVRSLELKNAVAEICPGVGDKPPSVASLGKRIGKFRGRFIGNRSIDAHEEDHKSRWYVFEN